MPFHLSPEVSFLFGRQPFQGCNPSSARFVFVGEDANFAPDIELQPIWPRVAEYLNDGVEFWNRHGVHHPFLLPEYNGQGTVYHRHYHSIFTRDQGDPSGAEAPLPSGIRQSIAFVEYLDRPTTGNDNINDVGMVNEVRRRWHFGWLAQLLVRQYGDPDRTVFLTKGVASKLRKDSDRLYPGLVPENPEAEAKRFPANARRHQVVIHRHACDYLTGEQRRQLNALIRQVLNQNSQG